MQKYSYTTVDSITKIDPSDWERIFPDIPQGYGFYKNLEEAQLKEFSFSYILVYENEALALIAPLFTADFYLDIGAPTFIQKSARAMRKIFPRFFTIKTLFCGCPIAEHGIIGIKKDALDTRNLIIEFTNGLEDISKRKKISMIALKDFLGESLPVLKPLQEKGYFLVETFPTVRVDLSFDSFEEYLMSLGHSTRKNLRRKMKPAEQKNNFTVKVTDTIEQIADNVYQLYLNTYNAGTVKFEKLSKEFFLGASKNLKGKTKFFLYYLDDKLIAFNFCLIHHDLLIDEFIGFDYESAYKYNLYFYSWCYNIRWCLENKIRFYQVGQTDYHPKIRLGGKLIPLYALGKHANPLIQGIMRLMIRIFCSSGFKKK